MICVEDLTKKFIFGEKISFWKRNKQEREVVKHISFTIPKGEIVGFLGPNGAGKSTTIKMLTGILYPSSGNATVLGYIPWERKVDFRKRIAVVMGQKSQLWPDLPARDSFELCRTIYDIDGSEYDRTIKKFVELLHVEHLMGTQIRRLSLGEKMKMELIAALLHRPEVIFLDEPTIGLDIQAQRSIRTFIKEYNQKEGATIVLTSHQMSDIEDLCERAIIIDQGEIIFDGNLKNASCFASGKKLITLYGMQFSDIRTIEKYGNIRQQAENKVVIEVDRCNIRTIASNIVREFDVTDFDIEDVPLEETLAKLYENGKGRE